jgi:hypothetical protein
MENICDIVKIWKLRIMSKFPSNPRKRSTNLISNFTSVEHDPYGSRFDMPSTRAEMLSELDALEGRLAEIAEELELLSADEKRLSDQLDSIRDTLLSFAEHC